MHQRPTRRAGSAAAARSPRVVFVLGRYAVGGAEKQLANLIFHRPEFARDVDVHVITLLPTSSAAVEHRFESGGAKNTLVDRQSQGFVRFMYSLVGAMRRLRPDIVSTFLDSSTGAWGRLAAVLARVPVIVHSDRLLATEGTRAHYLVRPYLDRVTRRFLPNAEAIADRLAGTGVPRDRIRVMPNGVDLVVFDPGAVRGRRADWGIADGASVLGYLGRFAPQKRVDLLAEALLRLAPEHRPDHVLLAGDGPTMPQVRALVEAAPWLRERCRFVGATDDTPSFLATVDYLVLPSDSEGIPNVVLEAMAMARPVVATDVSDVAKVIGDTGLVVPPGDAAALGEAITQMQTMGAVGRGDLGARARRRIELEYDVVVRAEQFWEAHLELLAELAGAKGEP